MPTDALVLLVLAGAAIVGLWIGMFARRPRGRTEQPDQGAGNGSGRAGNGGAHEASDASSADGGEGGAGGGNGDGGD